MKAEVRPVARGAEREPSQKASEHLSLATAKDRIAAYFDALNRDDFQASAELFAAEGQLLPPFESAIVGREAVAAYLQAEAKGMRAVIQTLEAELLPSGAVSLRAIGQVQAPLFAVNVSWQFIVNSASEIVSVKIKLLAALKDLINFKR